ncbi:hypothetical protein CA850_29735 [Micromonospora echinospora]|uniref:Putative peptidoglycan binding domain-containing protein n=1 Tax=Micromonospora echinospora TaxID=1877 RepID=A0A1C5AB03_MICEC|nr:peptidoglycan-binding protein [Micromonospora echinospora]OZV74761.1 hypothetical protein CA850_29735 [Micromonospora echinospora]SCF42390.1 Putative peptidoglycan binding domain-containing protein [Micromonospora echinospora]
MSSAPNNLKAVRTLLLNAFEPYGLSPLSVGIVGDEDHDGGYHCGSDRTVRNDYSVVESPRDRAGLTRDAAAVDIGMFSYGAHNLRTFSLWLVGECAKGAPDTLDIREVIYSPDGKTVKRWDRLKRRSSGDRSHLTHTHISFFRDAIRAGRDLTPLFRRYVATVGRLEAALFCAFGDKGEHVKYLQYRLHNLGFDVGTVDGSYGAKTASALAAAVRAHNGRATDGKRFGAAEAIYLDVLWSRRYGQGAQGPAGPQGPEGPAGPQGPKGDPGPPGGLTLADVLGELSARLAG